MSTTTVLRPVGTGAATAWTYVGGPSTLHGVTGDDLDSTYAQANANNGYGVLQCGTFSMPAGAQIRSVQPKIRMSGSGVLFDSWLVRAGYTKTIYYSPVRPPVGATDYALKPATKTPEGGPWNTTNVNQLRFVVNAQSGIKYYRLELDVVYNEQPVVSAVTPTGSVTSTAQPTIGWTYTDPENDPQERWLVRIFTDPLPAGFNPETATPLMDSGTAYVGASQTTTWQVPKALPVGTYWAYVKASDLGSSGRYSQWASSSFTMAGPPPAPPILVSVTADAANGRNTIVAEQADSLLTLGDYGAEELTGGFMRWAAVTGLSAGPSVVAGAGINSSNGIQATANGSAAVSARTPIGIRGYRVKGSTLYSASGWVKASAAGGTATLALEWYDSTGTLIQAGTQGNAVTLSTSFQKSQVNSATSPSNAVYALLRWTTAAALTNGVLLTWDNGQLRRGASVATDYRGGLDSTNILDPQDSTWASTSLTGTTWTIVGTGSLAAAASSNAFDAFELQVAPGTVGGSHVLKLGTPIRLPVLGGLPNASYQFQFQGRAAAGSNLKADAYLYFLDDSSRVIGAPVYGGQTALANTTYVSGFMSATAPVGASQIQPQLVLSGEAATTDRWGFDSFGIIRVPENWFFQQAWRPASQVDTFAIVEYSDDGGVTWAEVRWTETSLYWPDTRLATVYDYEAPPNVSRTYRVRTGALDYQSDPTNGSLLTSAPSSTGSATLPVTGWWLVDPYTQTRVSLPISASIPNHAPMPEGEFAPLGRPNKVIVSDVGKGDELSLTMLFKTGAAYKAFDVMRDTGHVLFLQSDMTDSWYVRLGDSRDAELLNSASRLAAGGIYQVAIRAVQVDRPA